MIAHLIAASVFLLPPAPCVKAVQTAVVTFMPLRDLGRVGDALGCPPLPPGQMRLGCVTPKGGILLPTWASWEGDAQSYVDNIRHELGHVACGGGHQGWKR